MAFHRDALIDLAAILRAEGYCFTTVTPATHARVLARSADADAGPLSTRDIFGWCKPFTAAQIAPSLLRQMALAGVLGDDGLSLRSTVRAATLGGQLYFHSAYPTDDADAVFFGPDTYRFVRAVEQVTATLSPPLAPRRVIDIGCGAGAGAVALARRYPQAEVLASDINQQALALTSLNSQLAGAVQIDCRLSDMLDAVSGQFDLIIANPPYLLDARERAYRHGGGVLGAGLSLRIVETAISRLAPGGALLLYTGVAMEDGVDGFERQARALLARAGFACDYDEIDPDVFGEELATPAYAHTERIAAVLLCARAPAT